MPEPKLRISTIDVVTLLQLESSGRLKLKPEYQRGDAWPRKAKAHFVGSIFNGHPIRPIYLQRLTSVQSGRTEFAVVNGHEEILTLKEFLDDGFGLTKLSEGSVVKEYKGKKFSHLPLQMQRRLLKFEIVVLELSGSFEPVIREVFAYMSKHVERLSKQDLEHAKKQGRACLKKGDC